MSPVRCAVPPAGEWWSWGAASRWTRSWLPLSSTRNTLSSLAPTAHRPYTSGQYVSWETGLKILVGSIRFTVTRYIAYRNSYATSPSIYKKSWNNSQHVLPYCKFKRLGIEHYSGHSRQLLVIMQSSIRQQTSIGGKFLVCIVSRTRSLAPDMALVGAAYTTSGRVCWPASDSSRPIVPGDDMMRYSCNVLTNSSVMVGDSSSGGCNAARWLHGG